MAKYRWNEEAVLRGAWRRVFSKSPIVREVLDAGKRYVPKYNTDGTRAKKDAVEFHCQVCNQYVRASLNGKRNIAVDHIKPVISTDNVDGKIQDWNEFKRRLFCGKENLQRICGNDHRKKTNDERLARTIKRDTQVLIELEVKIKQSKEKKAFKKELSKYLSKKKPEVIRSMALILKNSLQS